MKVYKKQERTVEVEAVIDVVCNGCGRTMVTPSGGYLPDKVVGRCYLGLLDGEVEGCFGSRVLLDTHRYRFSLCETCLVVLFDGFTVPPSVTEYDPSDGEPDREALTWADDRKIRERMDDAADALERWECACPEPIRIDVGRLGTYWHRNLLFQCLTERDGIFHLLLPCLGLDGRGATDEKAYADLGRQMQELFDRARATNDLPGVLARTIDKLSPERRQMHGIVVSPPWTGHPLHWMCRKRPEAGWG